jgi:hypothetical protein
LDIWSLLTAKKVPKAVSDGPAGEQYLELHDSYCQIAESYNRFNSRLLMDVFLRIELQANSDLPPAEKVCRLFRAVSLALAVAVGGPDLWEWRAGQSCPQLTMEIVVEGHLKDSIVAKINVD